MSGFALGYFFNTYVSDTTTTAGRNIIAVSALTNELLYGWYHFYTFDAHMKLINVVVNEPCDELCSRFTYPEVDVETILKHMLGDYYDGYYRLSSLRHRIETMTPNQRKVLYLKNNMKEFYKIPEVKEVLRRIILVIREDNMIIPLDNGASLMNPFAHKGIKDDINTLMQWVQDVAFGMHYYEGDYVNRVYQETMVDIVTSMDRRKIANMDTDSAVTTVSHDKNILLEMFKEEIGDKKNDFLFTEGALVMLLMTLYLGAIKRALKEYATAINIDEKLIHMLDLEAEINMEQEHLSISKKNYAFTTVVKDMVVKLGKMESRGFKFKKSDANADIAERVESDIKSRIMCHIQDLNFKDLINHIYDITDNLVKTIKTDDFIINKKSLVKIGDINDISWGDPRMKAVRLWDRLYPETTVEVPGSFGIIKIGFTQEMLDNYKVNRPEVYKELVKHSEELFKYGVQNKVINRVAQIMDPEDEDKDRLLEPIKESKSEVMKSALRTLIKVINSGNYSDRDPNEGLYETIYNNIYKNSLMPGDIKTIEKFFGITSTNFDPDKEITKNIDRIAVPIDINSVPDIFKENNYELLDIEAASEYEHLMSPLINTLSLSVVRNKSDNNIVTSVLQVF